MDEELERDPNVMPWRGTSARRARLRRPPRLWAKYAGSGARHAAREAMIAARRRGCHLRPAPDRRDAVRRFSYPASTRSCPRSADAVSVQQRLGLPMVIRCRTAAACTARCTTRRATRPTSPPRSASRSSRPAPRPMPRACSRRPSATPTRSCSSSTRRRTASSRRRCPMATTWCRSAWPRSRDPASTSRSSATGTCASARSRRRRRSPARTGSRPRWSTCAPFARWTPPRCWHR